MMPSITCGCRMQICQIPGRKCRSTGASSRARARASEHGACMVLELSNQGLAKSILRLTCLRAEMLWLHAGRCVRCLSAIHVCNAHRLIRIDTDHPLVYESRDAPASNRCTDWSVRFGTPGSPVGRNCNGTVLHLGLYKQPS